MGTESVSAECRWGTATTGPETALTAAATLQGHSERGQRKQCAGTAESQMTSLFWQTMS